MLARCFFARTGVVFLFLVPISSLNKMLTYISLTFFLATLTDSGQGRICVFDGADHEFPTCIDGIIGKESLPL